MVSSFTRRRFLAAGTAGTVALAGCAASDPPYRRWSPPDDGWFLPRHDPANTNHNPAVTPPDGDPDRTRFELDVPVRGLVSDGRHTVAYGSTGLGVLTSRSVLAASDAPAETAAFGPPADDPVLYHAGTLGSATDGRPRALVRGAAVGRDGTTTTLWSVLEAGGGLYGATGLVPTADGLLVGSDGDDALYALGSGGDVRWTVEGLRPALDSAGLVVAGRTRVAGYGDSAGPLSPDPSREWTTDPGTQLSAPVIADAVDLVLYGSRGTDAAKGRLHAVERASGTRSRDPVDLFPDAGAAEVFPPAVAGGTAYVGGYVPAGPGEPTPGRIAAVALDDWSIRWTRDVDGWAGPPVVAGDAVIVGGGGGSDAPGRVRAFGTAGEPRWTVETAGPTDALAPVDGTVWAGCRTGDLYALA